MRDTRVQSRETPSTLQARNALAAMVRAWRRERALRATIDKLASLGDHTLRDVGLHRGDIVAGVMRRSDES